MQLGGVVECFVSVLCIPHEKNSNASRRLNRRIGSLPNGLVSQGLEKRLSDGGPLKRSEKNLKSHHDAISKLPRMDEILKKKL
jgi:hypothetical protein